MKKTILKLCWACVFLFTINTFSFSQEYRLGGSGIYNFSDNGIGLGARVEFPIKIIPVLEGISIVPQVAYFPPWNKNTEFYFGSSVHLGVYSLNNWVFYALANVSYKQWINYKTSGDSTAKYSSMTVEGGIGITRNTCVRPFMEFRYNFIDAQPTVQVGILYTINCNKRGMVPCPHIPPPPKF